MEIYSYSKLIPAVEKRRVLYDNSNNSYRNSCVRKRAWNEVGKEVGLEASECQKKWKAIRDYYRRKQPLLRESAAEGKKNCCYFKQMAFLDPYIKSGKSDTIIENQEEEKRPVEMSSVEGANLVENQMEEKRPAEVRSVEGTNLLENQVDEKRLPEIRSVEGTNLLENQVEEKRTAHEWSIEGAMPDVDRAIIKLAQSSSKETVTSLRAQIIALEIAEKNLSKKDEELLFYQIMMLIHNFKRSDQ